MITRQTASRSLHFMRGSTIAIASCVGIALCATPVSRIEAQSDASAAVALPAEWRAWAFGHVGPAKTSLLDTHDGENPILASLAGGVAVSRGVILGMVRATDTESATFSDSPHDGVQDYALLAGLRSRGDRLFVAGAAGIAQATPIGTPYPDGHLAAAFDLSAHAVYRVAGLALTISGVLGSPGTRYIALSLGAELGWFGF